jgi:translation initiation factor IF-3
VDHRLVSVFGMRSPVAFKIRLNGELRGTPQVRVVAASGELLGVMTLAEALRLALEEGRDLVEVNPSAQPPVCKLMDFSKLKADALKPPNTDEPPDDE